MAGGRYHPHFIGEEVEAWSGKVTHPRPCREALAVSQLPVQCSSHGDTGCLRKSHLWKAAMVLSSDHSSPIPPPLVLGHYPMLISLRACSYIYIKVSLGCFTPPCLSPGHQSAQSLHCRLSKAVFSASQVSYSARQSSALLHCTGPQFTCPRLAICQVTYPSNHLNPHSHLPLTGHPSKHLPL